MFVLILQFKFFFDGAICVIPSTFGSRQNHDQGNLYAIFYIKVV